MSRLYRNKNNDMEKVIQEKIKREKPINSNQIYN